LGGDSNRGRKPKNKEPRAKSEERSPLRVPISSIAKEKHPLSVCSATRREGELPRKRCLNPEETGKRRRTGAEERNPQQVQISKEETTVSNNVVKEEREKIRMALSLSFTILKNFKR